MGRLLEKGGFQAPIRKRKFPEEELPSEVRMFDETVGRIVAVPRMGDIGASLLVKKRNEQFGWQIGGR
jgi:hypothetical protein